MCRCTHERTPKNSFTVRGISVILTSKKRFVPILYSNGPT